MVKNIEYIPSKGDIVWLQFNPQAGHEQKGRRPSIVLSPKEYNKKTGLALFAPITSQKKGYPFEVELSCKKISGVILSDHCKSLDWRARNIIFIEKSKKSEISSVLEKIQLLLS